MEHAHTKTERPLKTRAGGDIAFRGRVYETEEALVAALVDALAESGWKITPAGRAYRDGYREAKGAP